MSHVTILQVQKDVTHRFTVGDRICLSTAPRTVWEVQGIEVNLAGHPVYRLDRGLPPKIEWADRTMELVPNPNITLTLTLAEVNTLLLTMVDGIGIDQDRQSVFNKVYEQAQL